MLLWVAVPIIAVQFQAVGNIGKQFGPALLEVGQAAKSDVDFAFRQPAQVAHTVVERIEAAAKIVGQLEGFLHALHQVVRGFDAG